MTTTTDRFARVDRAARERREAEILSPGATRSADSRGREEAEEPDPRRTAFQRDRDRILYSLAFRRMKHKTQVFLNPEGDHFVTRLTHVLQVAQVARSLAAALGLNEDLTEAIALGHDVGHTPFGHTGEAALEPYFDGRWHHADQGVRIYRVLEPANLTWEVLDGIRAHTWSQEPPPATPEGWCVRYADRIAYLSHDALDAIRCGVLDADEFPVATTEVFGAPGREWIGRMIDATVEHSVATGRVEMEPTVLEAFGELRRFMFDRVYLVGENARHHRAAIDIIRRLMDHFIDHPDELPPLYRDSSSDVTTQAADHVAGMTDRYALALHDRLHRPTLFPVSDATGPLWR